MTMGIEVLAKSSNLDPTELDSLLMMKEASTFMSDTLNDVLNMQKIEEGKLELNFQPFFITDVIGTVLMTFQGPASAKNIRLERDLSGYEIMGLVGDRARVEHVIANLISNAIKFSAPNGRILIKVSSKPYIDSISSHGHQKQEVTLSVTDEGVGISPQHQQQLFTPYRQVRPGDLQEGRGSGMGLSISKQIVTLHGGTMECVSELGVGSTFRFTIPFDVTGSSSSSDRPSSRQSEKSIYTRPLLGTSSSNNLDYDSDQDKHSKTRKLLKGDSFHTYVPLNDNVTDAKTTRSKSDPVEKEETVRSVSPLRPPRISNSSIFPIDITTIDNSHRKFLVVDGKKFSKLF